MCLTDACLGSDEVPQKHMMPEGGFKKSAGCYKGGVITCKPQLLFLVNTSFV